jgi:transposase
MRYHHCQRHPLTPAGLIVDDIEVEGDRIVATARSTSRSSACPDCGWISTRVHSRYQRSLADLPAHGRTVVIRLSARRFRCARSTCPKKTFAERLDQTIALPFGRRTARLESIVHQLGLALGGRPGQGLARRLLLPVSKDTLLRVVRLRAVRRVPTPHVVGIDDWAWKRGHRYGTIVCDLERRRIIDVLPDRESATVEAWLAARPSITIIARDRGAGYGQAAARGRPNALQIADRWHLMENASAAFLNAVRRTMGPIREALKIGAIDPALLTSAERRQYEGWRRRDEANAVIRALAAEGVPIKEIARRTAQARGIVRLVVRGGRTDVFRPRSSSLAPFLTRLEAEWAGGCRNGAELWRRLRAVGFPGAPRVVSEWAARRRADEIAKVPRRVPSSRAIARMMTAEPEQRSIGEVALVIAIETAVPGLAAARDLMGRFHALIRNRDGAGLDAWIEDAAGSLLGSFATGLAHDRDAVRAAIVEPWSNGQTEGQITKLKLVKRQMYGRAKLDLLRARLLGAA